MNNNKYTHTHTRWQNTHVYHPHCQHGYKNTSHGIIEYMSEMISKEQKLQMWNIRISHQKNTSETILEIRVSASVKLKIRRRTNRKMLKLTRANRRLEKAFSRSTQIIHTVEDEQLAVAIPALRHFTTTHTHPHPHKITHTVKIQTFHCECSRHRHRRTNTHRHVLSSLNTHTRTHTPNRTHTYTHIHRYNRWQQVYYHQKFDVNYTRVGKSRVYLYTMERLHKSHLDLIPLMQHVCMNTGGGNIPAHGNEQCRRLCEAHVGTHGDTNVPPGIHTHRNGQKTHMNTIISSSSWCLLQYSCNWLIKSSATETRTSNSSIIAPVWSPPPRAPSRYFPIF